MTPLAKIRLALLVCSVLALLVRSPSVKSLRQRPMWFALLALTIELLLLQQPVAAAVTRATGIAYLTVFVGGFCHMTMTMIIWIVSAGDASAPRGGRNAWRWWFAGVTVPIIGIAEVVTVLEPAGPGQRDLPQPTGANALTVAWIGYLLFIAVSSSDATVRLWRHVRTTSFPAIRLALGILCLGTSASLVYVVARAVTLVDPSAGATPVVLYASTVYFLCFAAGCVTVLAGPLIEAVTAWWQRCRLFRLWRSVTAVVPEVVLEECPSYWTDLRRVRGNKVRLHRRVVEIHDATLTLREWVSPEQVADLTEEVRRGGLTGDSAAATVAARCLEAGRAAKASGREPSAGGPGITSGGGAGIEAELRWLMLVRRAYRDRDVAPAAQPADAPTGRS